MKTIQEANNYYKRFHLHLNSHPNKLIKNLSALTILGNPTRRLKRKWCKPTKPSNKKKKTNCIKQNN